MLATRHPSPKSCGKQLPGEHSTAGCGTSLIWQPRNRLAFTCDALDADMFAHEFASLTWDPSTIKHQLMSHRQRIAGYRTELLKTWSTTHATGTKKETSRSDGNSDSNAIASQPDRQSNPTRTKGQGKTRGRANSDGTSESNSESSGIHEVNVPIHEDVEEVSSVTFKSFDEERSEWGKVIRTLRTGEALAKFYNDPELYRVIVDEDPIPDSQRLREAKEELIQKNFESDIFVSSARLDQEAEEIRLSLFQSPRICISPTSGSDTTDVSLPDSNDDRSGLE